MSAFPSLWQFFLHDGHFPMLLVSAVPPSHEVTLDQITFINGFGALGFLILCLLCKPEMSGSKIIALCIAIADAAPTQWQRRPIRIAPGPSDVYVVCGSARRVQRKCRRGRTHQHRDARLDGRGFRLVAIAPGIGARGLPLLAASTAAQVSRTREYFFFPFQWSSNFSPTWRRPFSNRINPVASPRAFLRKASRPSSVVLKKLVSDSGKNS